MAKDDIVKEMGAGDLFAGAHSGNGVLIGGYVHTGLGAAAIAPVLIPPPS